MAATEKSENSDSKLGGKRSDGEDKGYGFTACVGKGSNRFGSCLAIFIFVKVIFGGAVSDLRLQSKEARNSSERSNTKSRCRDEDDIIEIHCSKNYAYARKRVKEWSLNAELVQSRNPCGR